MKPSADAASVPGAPSGPIRPGAAASTPALREPLADLLRMAVWFGLLAGFCEAAVLATSRLVLHQPVRLGPHLVWMAPVGDVFFFVLAALVLALLAARWPRLGSVAAAGLVLSFLFFLSLLLLFERLHPAATVLLAGGLAWQAARRIQAHVRAWRGFVRPSVWVGGVLVLGTMLGVVGWRELEERRVLASLPPPPPEAPNVLLIVLDTVRAQSLSSYGYERPTSPELADWARTGVLFERAFATAPWTLPSHATMFTGLAPHEITPDWSKPLGPKIPTLAERFRSHGYVTAGFAANVFYVSREHGLDRGFVHYEDFPLSAGEVLRTPSLAWPFSGRPNSPDSAFRRVTGIRDMVVRKSAEQLNRDVLEWLPRRGSRPFFVFLNYFDAHEPYVSPAPFDALFRTASEPEGLSARLRGALTDYRRVRHLPPDRLQGFTDAYDGSLAYLDHHVGALLRELRSRRVLANTVVAITSDHGEQLGEHGLVSHGNSLYAPLLHVPLVLVAPGRVPTGTRVAEPVSLRDLAATLAHLAGLPDHVPGRSLARFWEAGSAGAPAPEILVAEVDAGFRTPAWEPASRGDMKSLVAYPFHYILNGDGGEELYDLETDPSESRDLAKSTEGRRALVDLRASLDRLFSPSSPPAPAMATLPGAPGHAAAPSAAVSSTGSDS